MSFLVDTDICSAYLKGDNRVYGRFVQYGGRLHVSAVTAGQLFTWALVAGPGSNRMQRLLGLLRHTTFSTWTGAFPRSSATCGQHKLDRAKGLPTRTC